jgi:hypothetical protein
VLSILLPGGSLHDSLKSLDNMPILPYNGRTIFCSHFHGRYRWRCWQPGQRNVISRAHKVTVVLRLSTVV